MSGILFILGSTQLAYSAENLLVLLGGWVLSTVPFFLESWFASPTWLSSRATRRRRSRTQRRPFL